MGQVTKHTTVEWPGVHVSVTEGMLFFVCFLSVTFYIAIIYLIVVPQDEDVYNERARIQNMSSEAIGTQSVILKDLAKVRKQVVLQTAKVEAGLSCSKEGKRSSLDKSSKIRY